MTSALSSEDRVKVALLAVLALGTVLFSLFMTAPGHISVDESVYHLMARSFSQSGSLALLNGYEEFAAPELVFPISHPHDGQLYPQYPYLYPVLAAPFYLAFGYKGLFFLNAAAFIVTVALCYAIGQRLFADRGLSLNACLILILATYAWEYGQATWPHAVSMLFVAGAFYLALSALQATRSARALALAFAAGLVASLGAGVRIDVFFAVPALILPYLFCAPPRLLPVAATGLGMLPGLALLSATNYAKFGVLSPLSYGAQVSGKSVNASSYLPVFFLGLVAVLAIWALTRPRGQALLAARPWRWSLVLAAAAGALLLVPEVWAMVTRFANGAYQLVVDLRIRDPAIVEGGLTRGPGGGMIYMGALKKSLLQSCPYLVVLLLPLAYMARLHKDAPQLSLLFLVPAGYVGAYSYFAWHGGLCLNLRYFVALLPFTSLLASYGWRELMRLPGSSNWGLTAGAVLALAPMAVLIGANAVGPPAIETFETLLLTAPLVLSAVILATLIGIWAAPEPWRPALAGSAVAGVLVAFAWAGTVAFTYDFPRAWAKRAILHQFSNEVADFVAPDSMVIAEFPTALAGLYELDRIRVAQGIWDETQSFRPLLDHHLAAGRPAYGWFQPETWDELQAAGLLSGLRTVPLHFVGLGQLARFVEVPPATAGQRIQPARPGPLAVRPGAPAGDALVR